MTKQPQRASNTKAIRTTAGRARGVAVPAAPARREGGRGDLGPKPRGEPRQLSMSHPGTAPPRGRPGAGPRGGAARGGARGAGRRKKYHKWDIDRSYP